MFIHYIIKGQLLFKQLTKVSFSKSGLIAVEISGQNKGVISEIPYKLDYYIIDSLDAITVVTLVNIRINYQEFPLCTTSYLKDKQLQHKVFFTNLSELFNCQIFVYDSCERQIIFKSIDGMLYQEVTHQSLLLLSLFYPRLLKKHYI